MRISDWSSDVCSSDLRIVPGWRAALLCGSADLAYATGLRAGKRYVLFNGALECSLIVCDPIARPRAAANPDATQTLSEGATMVANRLRKNLRSCKDRKSTRLNSSH